MTLKQQWQAEEQAVFAGWDFSHLTGRWQEDPIKWDYAEIVRQHLHKNHVLLDMGTGGGEFLLTLHHPHHLTHVTEAHPPNVTLCRERLAPLGIHVKQVFGDASLPFADETFDIIINRHESFHAGEVRRILKPGGVFITQQVGAENSVNLASRLLPGFEGLYPTHTLENTAKIVKSAGFEITLQDEDFPMARFYDIGALVYFAKAIEWEFPGFSVDTHFAELCELQAELEKNGYIENREHRFIIVARRV